MMTVKPLCIHHHPCLDGFTAAWAVWKAFGGLVDFHQGAYDKPPPDVAGRHVIMVDFSYKRDVILDMMTRCASMLILDHHKSAMEELDGFPPPARNWQHHLDDAVRYTHASPMDRIGVRFDMAKSGAVMAWEYFHHGRPLPSFLATVQDRDLWQFKLRDTRLITAAAFSYPYEFPTFDQLVFSCEDSHLRTKLITEGQALLRQHDKNISELLPKTKRRMFIGGELVWVANLPPWMASDAAGQLAEGEPFAGTYWDSDGYRNFSLRSRGARGEDVSLIAKFYGGGGHRNAAGFQVPLQSIEQRGLL